MYLRLRKLYADSSQEQYDPKFKELDDIRSKAEKGIDALNELSTSERVVDGLFGKIHKLYEMLLNQYRQLRTIEQQTFQSQTALGKTGMGLFSQDLDQLAAASIGYGIPQHFNFEYVKGKQGKKRKGRQREFTARNRFSQKDCLTLIQKTAEQRGLSIFHKVFLLAEKAGLVEFRCRMYRTMSNGGKQVYQTEGKAYGLEIVLYVRETQQQFVLTQPTPGYAKWSSAHKRTTATTIKSHKLALPKKTKFLGENIQHALKTVSQLLNLESSANALCSAGLSRFISQRFK